MLLSRLLLFLVCSIAVAQVHVHWINPSQKDDPSEYPVWPPNSKQQLEWNTTYGSYSIGVFQTGQTPGAVGYGDHFYGIMNGTGVGRHVYEWTVNIPASAIADSPTFYISMVQWGLSDPGTSDSGFFNVSNPDASPESSAAPPVMMSSSSSAPSVSTISRSSSLPSPSSSTAEPTTSTEVVSLSSTESATSAASSTSSSASPTGSQTPDTMLHTAPPASTESSSSAPPSTTTSGVKVVAATDAMSASIHAPRENDLGIWMGVSLGIGLPAVALAAVGAFWAYKRQHGGVIALNH